MRMTYGGGLNAASSEMHATGSGLRSGGHERYSSKMSWYLMSTEIFRGPIWRKRGFVSAVPGS
jgi:hypothetical protein